MMSAFRIWTAGKFGRSYRHRRFYVVRLRNLSFRLFRVGDWRAFGKIVTWVWFGKLPYRCWYFRQIVSGANSPSCSIKTLRSSFGFSANLINAARSFALNRSRSFSASHIENWRSAGKRSRPSATPIRGTNHRTINATLARSIGRWSFLAFWQFGPPVSSAAVIVTAVFTSSVCEICRFGSSASGIGALLERSSPGSGFAAWRNLGSISSIHSHRHDWRSVSASTWRLTTRLLAILIKAARSSFVITSRSFSASHIENWRSAGKRSRPSATPIRGTNHRTINATLARSIGRCSFLPFWQFGALAGVPFADFPHLDRR